MNVLLFVINFNNLKYQMKTLITTSCVVALNALQVSNPPQNEIQWPYYSSQEQCDEINDTLSPLALYHYEFN